MSLLIKNGTIVRTGEAADIWIRDKRIEEIAPDIGRQRLQGRDIQRVQAIIARRKFRK